MIKFNQIKEAHDIEKKKKWQEEVMFFSATTATKSYKVHSYQGSTPKSTSHRRGIFFIAATGDKKNLNEIKETHKIQAKGIQAKVMCFQCNY